VLTDGRFFINRWFAIVEIRSKTLIPIGHVGVVVSYYGTKGDDVTGTGFRYGEQVEPVRGGVWQIGADKKTAFFRLERDRILE